jgi:glycogen operon protein
MRRLEDTDLPGKAGVELTTAGTRFTVRAPSASAVTLCLFDQSGHETGRHDLGQDGDGTFTTMVDGLEPGARYGFRADGPWQPENGHRF